MLVAILNVMLGLFLTVVFFRSELGIKTFCLVRSLIYLSISFFFTCTSLLTMLLLSPMILYVNLRGVKNETARQIAN